MDFRAHVYSPLQNQALWLAATLYGEASFDDADYALTELGGPQRFEDEEYGLAPLIRQIRSFTSGFMDSFSSQPALSLTLAGPGTPVGLPAASAAAGLATSAGGAIVLASERARAYAAAVPLYGQGGTQWRWFELEGYPPAPAYLSPGEADFLLTTATREAAELIERMGPIATDLPNPRLTVGTLSDFYDTPGLPSSIAPRAAKLIARADRVSAIIETVTARVNDHTFDPELLSLGRHIRQARMSAITYATVEWARVYDRNLHAR
ncbi:hypothetical protein [Corynebacterium vitaeruminis]|uniref:hypothetical protein n=1 Tax=Corynebacterium vitaeruminis TaxID=38305 RepID=UPI0023F7684A|nr:hypothetical protein [Corynebacterium vitaeruminis]